MKAIGGYFELELNNFGSIYHDKAIALNCGRTALEYILLSNKEIEKVYIPYFTCDVTLQPIKRLKLDYEFYYLDENFQPKLETLGRNQSLLYVNYFGIMNHVLDNILSKFKSVIVDNSQAFFSQHKRNTPTFYSPRKFFGVPDGGLVYSDNYELLEKLTREESIGRTSHLVKRIEYGPEKGYISFIEENEQLNNIPLRKMSLLTEKLLGNINYTYCKERRNDNFKVIHNALKSLNQLTAIINKEHIDGPMVYPFLKEGNSKLKIKLIKNKVYVATYWPNVKNWINDESSFEAHLQDNIIPIPIDHRYNDEDMKFILTLIKN